MAPPLSVASSVDFSQLSGGILEMSACFCSESPGRNVALIALGPSLNVRLVTIEAEVNV
jgi:hypothetical protein